jgi:hypothetical protein
MVLRPVCILLAYAVFALTSPAQDLREAVRIGDVDRVKALLESGVDVNEGRPIFFADKPEVVDLLLVHGAKLEMRALGSIQTPIEHAAAQYFRDEKRRDNWRAIVGKLRAAGAVYTIDTAIYLNDIKFVESQLAKDDSWVNSRRGAQSVRLRISARTGRVEICKLLLEHHADPDAFEEGWGYPIIKEALKYPAIVKLLIDHGADLKRRITWQGGRTGAWVIGDNATALHYAAADGVPESVALLIDHGVDIFARTQAGYGERPQMALDVAAIFGRPTTPAPSSRIRNFVRHR